jgi:hypothetical protein
MTSLLFLTKKTTCKRQSIYYIVYPKRIIWKLPQKKDEGIWFCWDRSTKDKNYYNW